MKSRRWSPRVLGKYFLLQAPAAALLILILSLVRHWVDIPGWLFWTIIGLWVAKDILLYPFLWHAYDPDAAGDHNSMVGAQGIVRQPLAPAGYIEVRGELWRAEVPPGSPPLEEGKRVRVRDVRGLTLLVEPDEEAGP